MKTFASVVLAGYFFLGGLMPHMDFCELLKIPSLAHHFQEHKELDKELGIIEFISVHYGSENPEPPDEHQLPFKDHHCCTGHTHSALVSRIVVELAPNQFKEHPKDTYSFHFTSPFFNTIWQPPKFS